MKLLEEFYSEQKHIADTETLYDDYFWHRWATMLNDDSNVNTVVFIYDVLPL